ncbi:MAG TPA: glutathione S-transferase family protein [Pyrinomonadaceae bacterium]|nr:glutathione S-transferase family protein [Pyrinomonadaceae bacterium]
MANVELYHFWDSFCSYKVRICLEEKGVAWTDHYVDLMTFENLKPEYLAINPKGVVPTLKYEGTFIFESSIINEFLDDKYPEPSLRPVDPLDRARMRYWVNVEEDELFTAVRPASLNLMMKKAFARYTEADLDKLLSTHPRPYQIPLLKKMFLDPPDSKAVEQSRKALTSTLTKMDKALTKSGPWLAGKTYSLADIAAAPVIDRIQRLGMQDIWEKLPAIKNWIAQLTSRRAYIKAAPLEKFRMPKPMGA